MKIQAREFRHHMQFERKRISLGRLIGIWAGSFAVIAACLYVWAKVPIFPLVLGGLITLIVTLVRGFNHR